MDYLNVQNVRLPLVGLGTFLVRPETMSSAIKAAVDNGCCLIDTAQRYGNENDIRVALGGNGIVRDNVILETKVSGDLLLGNLRYLRLNRRSIKSTYRESCQNLGTNYLDIYLIHAPYNGFEKHYCNLIKLQEETDIKLIGICNVTIDHLKQLKTETGAFPQLIQIEMHPYFTNKDLLLFCKDNDIAVESRSPFVHGDAFDEWNKEPVLLSLSNKYNKTIPQIILRWVTQQDVIALPRSNNAEHILENSNIFDFTLERSEIEKIDELNKNKSFGCKSSKLL